MKRLMILGFVAAFLGPVSTANAEEQTFLSASQATSKLLSGLGFNRQAPAIGVRNFMAQFITASSVSENGDRRTPCAPSLADGGLVLGEADPATGESLSEGPTAVLALYADSCAQSIVKTSITAIQSPSMMTSSYDSVQDRSVDSWEGKTQEEKDRLQVEMSQWLLSRLLGPAADQVVLELRSARASALSYRAPVLPPMKDDYVNIATMSGESAAYAIVPDHLQVEIMNYLIGQLWGTAEFYSERGNFQSNAQVRQAILGSVLTGIPRNLFNVVHQTIFFLMVREEFLATY